VAIKVRQAVGATLALVWDPFDYAAAQRLADSLAHFAPVRRLQARMVAHLTAAERGRLRQLTLEPLDMHALSSLPARSFGRRFAEYMADKRLDPDAPTAAFPPIARSLDEDWLLRRFVKTHDMLHLLSGFDLDVPGEMGLQLLQHRNFGEPYGLLALLATPLVVARYGRPRRVLGEVARGVRLARRAENLFCFPFEEHFGDDFDELRRRLGLA
jgi:ubiquinone biosynthesis protein Coq4